MQEDWRQVQRLKSQSTTLEEFLYLQLLVQAIESDGTTMSSAWITFALGFACGAIVSPIVLFSWMIHEDKKLQAKWSRDL